jgi:hypothetical protein
MKRSIFGSAVVLAATSVALGSQQPQAPAGGGVDALSLSNFSFSENINFYNLNTGNVTEFLQKVDYRFSDKLDLHLVLPVYTDGSTGAGMFTLGAQYQLLTAPVSFVDSVDFGLDLKLPTDSAGFGGSGVNPVLNAGVDGKTPIDKLIYSTSASWEWNTNGDYLPIFGGFITNNVLDVDASLNYEVIKDLSVVANYNFWYLDSGSSLNTIGPGLNWSMCDNASFDFACDIPFAKYHTNNLDLVVRFGLSVKF